MGIWIGTLGAVLAFTAGYYCRRYVEHTCPGTPGLPCGQRLLCPIHDSTEITAVQTAYPSKPRPQAAA